MSLVADDISAGMYVTVLSAMETTSFSLFGGHSAAVDKSMHGLVQRVAAVSYPYVAVVDLAGTIRHIDLRERVLARVSGEYVRAMKKAYAKAMKQAAENALARDEDDDDE